MVYRWAPNTPTFHATAAILARAENSRNRTLSNGAQSVRIDTQTTKWSEWRRDVRGPLVFASSQPLRRRIRPMQTIESNVMCIIVWFRPRQAIEGL